MCRQDQTLLSHPCHTSNICENDVCSNIAFVEGFDDEPGSNVMSFIHHASNWSILTARKHMDLAFWLMTQQTWWASGSAVEVGHFLSVKSRRSKFHHIPFLWYINSCIVPKGIASCKIHEGEQSSNTCSNLSWYLQVCDAILVVICVCISKSVMLTRVSFWFVLNVLEWCKADFSGSVRSLIVLFCKPVYMGERITVRWWWKDYFVIPMVMEGRKWKDYANKVTPVCVNQGRSLHLVQAPSKPPP